METRLAPLKRTGSEEQDEWTVAEPVPMSSESSEASDATQLTPQSARSTPDSSALLNITTAVIEPVQDTTHHEGLRQREQQQQQQQEEQDEDEDEELLL